MHQGLEQDLIARLPGESPASSQGTDQTDEQSQDPTLAMF